jgi:REP element-mobilizing transposase RayT
MEPEKLSDRQSIRLKGWDYSSPDWYFVTMNTHEGKALFGVVVNGRMVLSEAGRVAEEEWRKSAELRKGLVLDEFVVMPNHVHGIVRLAGHTKGVDASRKGLDSSSPCAPNPCASTPNASTPAFGKPVAGSLGVFVGAYKAAVSRALGRMGAMHQGKGLVHQEKGLIHQAPAVWHRNYWDVIVRDDEALANIRRYIRNNPQNYEVVMQCGEPRFLGNPALMGLPKMGFLASRGQEEGLGAPSPCPGEAIISGFLSPMERAVFKAGLAQKRPLIWVKPWGLGTPDRMEQAAIDAGRLLLISPFPDSIEAPSVRRAAWCNEYVLAHCDRMVVGHLNPSGMLACILSERNPDLEIIYL